MEAKNTNKRAGNRQRASTASSKSIIINSTKQKLSNTAQNPARKHIIETKTLAVIAIIIIFAAIFSSLFYGLVAYKPTSFKAFASNFNKANSVSIYINYTNGTDYAPELSCSNALIEELIGSVAAHKNASQINLYVLYNDSCIYRQGSLGTLISNYTNATRSECLGYGSSEPSIFINYSNVNRTIITPNKLYFTGDAKFLNECGIAYQIT